jgi:predicted Zn-dependent peptidase
MRSRFLPLAIFAATLAAACTTAPTRPVVASASLAIPVESYRLDNGLRVVLSPDPAIPTVTVGVYYHIGFRLEPQGRTGFAHLFEHLMFQESSHLAKGEADQIIFGNGGIGNGSTRFDYTNYYEVVPRNQLERVLYLEAERMRGLAISDASIQNQKDVVKNEVRVNVLNQPYGGFPWLQLPQAANSNWHNAHNFYGELAEIDAATSDDVRRFYETYYVASNAVLVVAGDYDASTIKTLVERQFGALPNRPRPTNPDISEPRQTTEREVRLTDALAPRPAFALGYHLPERNTPDWDAFVLLDLILAQGEDSRLWRRLVSERGYTESIEASMNLLGSTLDYEGPMLWSLALIHDDSVSDTQILREIDAVVTELAQRPVGADELERARTKMRSELYDVAGSSTRFGLLGILACSSLFDDEPNKINTLESRLAAVTPQDIQRTAREYLRSGNRTLLHLAAGAGEKH